MLPIDVRATPDLNGPRCASTLSPGEVFQVAEERASPDGVIFLRLADGRGWVFDKKPGAGNMCQRLLFAPAQAVPPGMGSYTATSPAALPQNASYVAPVAPSGYVAPPAAAMPPGGSYVAPPAAAMPQSGSYVAPPAAPACGHPPSFPEWVYSPVNGTQIDIRASPDIDAERTPYTLDPGDVFQACEERMGAHGVLYFRLADGRGWVS